MFIIGTPLETAMALSKRHLNNQINEAKIILDALNGAKAWSNHPCVLQYREHKTWLQCYTRCLECYSRGFPSSPMWYSEYSVVYQPRFHTQEYFDQMKRRLFEKDEEHYKQWAHLGKSECNWYFVDDEWRKYVNGKRIE